MRLKTDKLVVTILVVGFIVIWRGNTDRDIAVAQGRKTVTITRIFTGPDGLAHAEDIELNLNARGATEMLKARVWQHRVMEKPLLWAMRPLPAFNGSRLSDITPMELLTPVSAALVAF